jgi:frataxin-like iron-binding protein CyaY
MPMGEYHRRADQAMDELMAVLEDVEAALPDADITSSVINLTFFSIPSRGFLNPLSYNVCMLQYGVLSINLGPKLGHWVINKQAPNQEIWWSSPVRYPHIQPPAHRYACF